MIELSATESRNSEIQIKGNACRLKKIMKGNLGTLTAIRGNEMFELNIKYNILNTFS